MFLRWPRGRYNGRRITGLKVSASFDLSETYWKPVFYWRLGVRYIGWLWVVLRFDPNYHTND